MAASYLGVSARSAQASQTPTPARKVARFISAETAKSKLHLDDGKLPELQLREGTKKDKKEAEVKSKTVNPLVLFGALIFSVVLSIILVMVDFSPPDKTSRNRKERARFHIRDKFFADHGIEITGEPLKPYQVLLRRAEQAHLRGDYSTERMCYRKVLSLLRAERGEFAKGVTGSRDRDKELEERINVLLGEN